MLSPVCAQHLIFATCASSCTKRCNDFVSLPTGRLLFSGQSDPKRYSAPARDTPIVCMYRLSETWKTCIGRAIAPEKALGRGWPFISLSSSRPSARLHRSRGWAGVLVLLCFGDRLITDVGSHYSVDYPLRREQDELREHKTNFQSSKSVVMRTRNGWSQADGNATQRSGPSPAQR